MNKQENKNWRNKLNAWYWPIVAAIITFIVAVELMRSVLGIKLGTFANLALYFGLYFVYAWIFSVLAGGKKERVPHPAENWPTSGPIRYCGRYMLLFTFYPTVMLSVLNPFQFVQQMKQIFGQIKAAKYLREHEEENANYKTKVSYRLPFKGEWLVFNGGLTKETSHSWGVYPQRYAYDFVVADENYRRHQNQGARLRDYFCYNQPILAAAAGEVITVLDRVRPAPLVGFGIADFLCTHFAGNHVVIRHADGEYGFYAHLIKGSIPVKVGDHVAQGQVIGHCGHTGHSSEPHLHFHLQNGPSFYSSMGLPIRFENAGEITRGERVQG